MKEREILMLIGIPGSGKSTFSKKFIEDQKELGKKWTRVNRDSIRAMLGYPSSESEVFAYENAVTKIENESIRAAIEAGYNVISDNTNVQLKFIKEFIDEFKTLANISFYIMETPIQVCIERNAEREEGRVPDADMDKMIARFDTLMTDSETTEYIRPWKRQPRIITRKFENHKKPCYIFDIDGTLAHMNGKRGPFDWKHVGVDDIDEYVLAVLRLLEEKYIILVSGRSEEARAETVKWLDRHHVPYDNLYMRAQDDYRGDEIVKYEIYKTHIEPEYSVLGVFDDRNKVVDMWRNKLGLKVFQCEPGRF